MMWQKARILRAPTAPQITGRTIWVKSEPPHIAPAISRSGKRLIPMPSFYVAVEPVGGLIPIIAAKFLELLPEFAEDVPLIEWEAFLNGADTSREEPSETPKSGIAGIGRGSRT